MLIRANSKQKNVTAKKIGATKANSTAAAPLRSRTRFSVLWVLSIMGLVVELSRHLDGCGDVSVCKVIENECAVVGSRRGDGYRDGIKDIQC